MISFTFDAIGTRWTIDMLGEVDSVIAQEVHRGIVECIESFDRQYSRFRNDSWVTFLSQNKGTYPLDEDGVLMFGLYKMLYHLTEGAVTPLIGSLLEEAGYDKDYSLNPKELHTPPTFESITFDSQSIILSVSTVIDVGAMGKGRLVDKIGTLLQGQGIASYIIDAGGDILYRPGATPLSVGLEHPLDPTKVIGVVQLPHGSIAASAGNRRKWGEYHHIMDPRTLKPVTQVLATWVIAETAMLADGLTTALFFTSPEKLKPHFTFSYLILYPDMHIQRSEDFPAEMFYTQKV